MVEYRLMPVPAIAALMARLLRAISMDSASWWLGWGRDTIRRVVIERGAEKVPCLVVVPGSLPAVDALALNHAAKAPVVTTSGSSSAR